MHVCDFRCLTAIGRYGGDHTNQNHRILQCEEKLTSCLYSPYSLLLPLRRETRWLFFSPPPLHSTPYTLHLTPKNRSSGRFFHSPPLYPTLYTLHFSLSVYEFISLWLNMFIGLHSPPLHLTLYTLHFKHSTTLNTKH